MGLLRYLSQLTVPKRVLWCYLLWYLTMVTLHFDPAPRLWLTSLGISVVIGTGLILSVLGPGSPRPDFWTLARLYMMPFCVSSFSALIKDQGFILIFAPNWHDNLSALLACAAFLLVTAVLARGLPRTCSDQSKS